METHCMFQFDFGMVTHCMFHLLAGVWRAMGIKGLAQVIGDFAAGAIKDQDIKAFFGRYIRTHE